VLGALPAEPEAPGHVRHGERAIAQHRDGLPCRGRHADVAGEALGGRQQLAVEAEDLADQVLERRHPCRGGALHGPADTTYCGLWHRRDD
jgi:hypothetical protein